MKSQYILFLALLFFYSCDKLPADYNKIPEDLVRMNDLQRSYQQVLINNVEGWFMEYKPGANNPSVPILMKFNKDGEVIILSDRPGFDQEKTSTYRIGGVVGPELIFDTYSVFSAIAENGGGVFDFRLFPTENGEFKLKHANKNLDTEFLLRKALPEDFDAINDRAMIGNLLKSFESNASAYFKNLQLTEVSAFWELDVNKQQLTLSWAKENSNEVDKKTFRYSTIAGKGIRLETPWQIRSGLEVSELFFGDATTNSVAIVDAGDAGTGEIKVSHIPPFPYKDSAKRFIWSNSFNPLQTPVNFYAGIPGTRETSITNFSPALWLIYEKIWSANVWPTFSRLQLYNYNGSNPKSNSIQLFGYINDERVWLAYFYAFDEMDGSHVMVRRRNQVPLDHVNYHSSYSSGIATTMYNNHPEVKDFLDKIYPPGVGITIVPLPGQRVRVVSRENSLYWMDLNIDKPDNFWTN
ncbi:DUF4302 domain-containing protein [Sphingobacterium paucimobilis]|uniref:DUF4302 domain-containing protein n=1 Tax=Sphingobacterium paucimobilis HER1398 TaxID=1346330 RepID=U2HDP6_9SPHI|nr:DUF4302 domain-containing protein [Sphingobacterium paucimobilis]ERJ59891.1 hypothetical protein M472_14055 [Sphingobacterium paucimobilis HER1398]